MKALRKFLVAHQGHDMMDLSFFVEADNEVQALDLWNQEEMVQDFKDPDATVRVFEVPALTGFAGVIAWPSPLIERPAA
jgi:hypothetical protein